MEADKMPSEQPFLNSVAEQVVVDGKYVDLNFLNMFLSGSADEIAALKSQVAYINSYLGEMGSFKSPAEAPKCEHNWQKNEFTGEPNWCPKCGMNKLQEPESLEDVLWKYAPSNSNQYQGDEWLISQTKYAKQWFLKRLDEALSGMIVDREYYETLMKFVNKLKTRLK